MVQLVIKTLKAETSCLLQPPPPLSWFIGYLLHGTLLNGTPLYSSHFLNLSGGRGKRIIYTQKPRGDLSNVIFFSLRNQ